MNKTIILLLTAGLLLGLQACEDVVDVDLDTEDPRLVIEATAQQWGHNSAGELRVKLSKTAPYFQDSLPKVRQAKVRITVNGENINLSESSKNPGVYREQIPMIYAKDYTLYIEVEGQQYKGTTQLYTTVPILGVEQEEGIFDSDEVLLKVRYSDPADTENYYLFSYLSKHGKALTITDDEQYNGNQVTTLYNEKFDPGDSLQIQIQGIDKNFYRYLSILLDQSDLTNNPFATAPTTVRGNMINVTHPENFPLGYFRISQTFEFNYVIE